MVPQIIHFNWEKGIKKVEGAFKNHEEFAQDKLINCWKWK